ncbi:MAG: GldG family protein [Betaproteobacteria bacterium]|nr:GldG family protein [Betaproteobacteria bacterium]
MQVTSKLRSQLLVQNGVFVVLLIALVALLAFLAQEYRAERDLTQNARNTVSQPAREVLVKISGPIKVTAFATRQDVRGDARKLIRDFLAPYQRLKPDLTVTFVDPREEPKLAQAAGIRVNGESVLEYNQRSEHLTDYNEQSFINALVRLARSSERLVMALEGHGERHLNGIANHDLGEFGKQLAAKGFKTNSVNLAAAQEVPANASMLLIANPQVDLQSAEVQKITQYLQQGGNLLWLIDPEPLRGLQPVTELLGLVLGPGTVVDPTLQPRNGPPVFASATRYARHPIFGDFQLNTVFPYARQIGVNDNSEWRATRLIDVAPRGWVEMDKLDDKITFDKARDTPGPVNIAVALERNVNDRAQRVVVIGNGNFLANTYLGNGGNLDLGVNIINWLAGDDALIAIQPRATIDNNLELGVWARYLIVFGFLILLPLAFVSAGLVIWWRRRKA